MDPSKAENSNMVKFITFDVAPVFILVLKVLFFFAALASRRRFVVCVCSTFDGHPFLFWFECGDAMQYVCI